MTKTQRSPMPTGMKVALVAGGSAFLIVVSAVFASAAQPNPAVEVARTATHGTALSASPTATPTPTPVVETKTVTVDESIPFKATTTDDSTVPVGVSNVTVPGRNGTNTKTYRVTLLDGVEQDRVLVSEAVTTAPVDEVTTVGTMQPPPPPAADPPPAASGCDPNYGGCVPIASDVDCAGGSGNGPAFVSGPIQVIGNDIYDLDRDGDGTACE
jgi:hypothetical protein